ncbi:CidA/LrgA family protein [Paraburkholderia guartelaensis]|uniref:CidA/LrgA family protein n=1 Tax=Paraburkholderia guartelaensis TaxID=2546446 RepID=A0A4R5LK25_9BURK|nr:CidA/LrgA family protein [Paraburkholderia guartelaensis]TDG10000.1 CidA/LrgA family protein [Paraburkholderia guartelaensis]
MRHPAASPTHAPVPVKADLAFVRTFALLVALQGVGEFIAWIARVPIPGPVIGLVLLLCLLSAAPRIERDVEGPALGLLNHLSLLFIPAGAGVFALASVLKGQLFAIAVAILVSTALSIAAGGLVTCALLERKSKPSMPSAKIEP